MSNYSLRYYYNGQYPGPTINVSNGELVRIKVENHLWDNDENSLNGITSLHCHGLHMRNYPWADGVPMVTECGIPIGSSFEYEFVAGPPGTHFYHAHAEHQSMMGLAGALVVTDPADAYAGLPEFLMFVSEWYGHGKAVADSFYYIGWQCLVNGRMGLAADSPLYDPAVNDFPTFNVQPAQTYRFRVVAAFFELAQVELSVEGHNVTVVAVDGAALEQLATPGFYLYPGNTVDFLLTTRATRPETDVFVVGLRTTETQGFKQMASCFAMLNYGPPVASTPVAASLPDPARAFGLDLADTSPLAAADAEAVRQTCVTHTSLSHQFAPAF